MILSVHQPQYLPWLGYFDKIAKSDCFVFLDQVQYKVREFQNRNKIRTKDGWIWLTVPVITKNQGREKISEVQIDGSRDWQMRHEKSLRIYYAKSKFLKEYFPFFAQTYHQKWQRLLDLNVHIIKYLLGAFKIKTPLYYESAIGSSTRSTDRILEICRKLGADVYLSGAGGKNYLEEEKFQRAQIKLKFQNFSHPWYDQQFAQGGGSFLPYMSAVDLLFNEGRNSAKILRQEKGKIR